MEGWRCSQRPCAPRRVPCPLTTPCHHHQGLSLASEQPWVAEAGAGCPIGSRSHGDVGRAQTGPHPCACPGSPRGFWEWILNRREASPGTRRMVNAVLVGIDSSKACARQEAAFKEMAEQREVIWLRAPNQFSGYSSYISHSPTLRLGREVPQMI